MAKSSALKVEFDLKGLQSMNRQLDKLIARATHLETFLDDASAYMVNVTRNRILRTKKDPDGRPWLPLAQLTIDIKGHGRQLFQTGKLAASITGERLGDEVVIYADESIAPYAPYMQLGVSRPRGSVKSPTSGRWVSPKRPIPPRPFIGLSATNIRTITEMLRKHLNGIRTRKEGAFE